MREIVLQRAGRLVWADHPEPQLETALGAIGPVVACICGCVPFKGLFAIGHERVGEATTRARTRQRLHRCRLLLIDGNATAADAHVCH